MNITYEILTTTKLTQKEEQQVSKINKMNLLTNGGQLHFEGVLPYKYAILAKHNNNVIAYALLVEDFIFDGDIYVNQIAVHNKYKHQGIGSAMYKYITKYISQYRYFSANVNENNVVSQKFHEKNGFQYVGDCSFGRIYCKDAKSATKSFETATKETFSIIKNQNIEMTQ